MIKIVSYRKYQDKFKVEKITDTVHMGEKWEAKSIPDLFLHIEDYLSLIPIEEHYDLHYTLADVYYGREFRSQSTLAIDIDDADLDQLDAYWAIVSECTGLDPSTFGIVKSGGGFHFLWDLDKPFALSKEDLKEYRKYYQMLCGHIQSKMIEAGVGGKVDNQILRASGTLRLPCTENRNYTPPRIAELIKRDIKTVEWDITKHVTGFKREDHVISPMEMRKYPSPDADFVKQECRFIKWNYEHSNEVDYNSWFAALSIVSKFKNYRDEAHLMSQGHSSYTFDDTETRLEQAREQGARTCANIDTLSDKCRNCPHFGSITSPIVLQGPNHIKSIDTGFWEMAIDKNGGLKRVKPDYEGLRLYFEKKYSYISITDGSIYTFNGQFWKYFEDAYIDGFIQEHLNPKPNNSHCNEFRSLLKRTNQRDPDWFGESIAKKMNLQNGVLNLDLMLLEPHSSKYGFLSVLPYEYSPTASCKTFDKFMSEITLGRKDLEDVLLEFAGYSFSGMDYIFHKALIMSGGGANGKSTFINVLKALAGKDFYSAVLLNELSQDTKRALIVGKLFNVAEETPRKSLDDSSAFKQLASGGEFQIKKLYKDTISIRNNHCKLIMACNEMPPSNDLTDGLRRRLMIVPFDAKFTKDVADVHIEKKLMCELPGILNRVIEGYKRLIRNNGFTESLAIEAEIEIFSNENNTIKQWVEEKLNYNKENRGHFISTNELYDHYLQFCDKIRQRYQSKIMMSRVLGEMFEKSSQKRIGDSIVKGFCGVSFKGGYQ